MSNKENKKRRKELISKSILDEEIKSYPDWCFCDGIFKLDSDVDWENDKPIGQTSPYNEDGYGIFDIYLCKRCGKKTTLKIVS